MLSLCGLAFFYCRTTIRDLILCQNICPGLLKAHKRLSTHPIPGRSCHHLRGAAAVAAATPAPGWYHRPLRTIAEEGNEIKIIITSKLKLSQKNTHITILEVLLNVNLGQTAGTADVLGPVGRFQRGVQPPAEVHVHKLEAKRSATLATVVGRGTTARSRDSNQLTGIRDAYLEQSCIFVYERCFRLRTSILMY